MGARWKKKVIKELREGQEYTFQLKHLLQNHSGEKHGYSVSAQELACKIMRSFSQSLSALSSCESSEVSQSQADSQCGDSGCSGDRRIEKSGESKKAVSNDRRGSYKRKRSAEARTVVSSTMEDGFPWRKYGQKDIHNSEYPRSYYRCSRKYDQGCKATKQVQQMEQDPKKYQIVYMGNHTCRGTAEATTLKLLREVSSDSTKDCSQGNTNSISNKQEYEYAGEENDDTIIWKDLMLLETGPDCGDVVDVSALSSCMDSNSHGLEFSFDFDTSKFHFA